MAKLFERRLSLDTPRGKSCILWGARKTGKSTILKRLFPDAIWYDLLQSDVFLRLCAHPEHLRQELSKAGRTVVIDEVQKVPALMDEIHWLIENRRVRFILSGSSPRKLLRGGGNLLGGRAWSYHLLPLTSVEVPNLNLNRALYHGLIPSHYLSSRPDEELRAYVGDYLREEVQAESLTRNLPGFARFLETVGQTNGDLLNFSNISRECAIGMKAAREYYQILVDTLLGFYLEPWRKRKKRRLIETPKFYLFDVGVAGHLAGRGPVKAGSESFGRAFEHFIIQETRAYSEYSRRDIPMAYWRTAAGAEVDLILGNGEVAVEIKSTRSAARVHTSGLRASQKDLHPRRLFLVTCDARPRQLDDGILILPWQDYCQRLWAGEII